MRIKMVSEGILYRNPSPGLKAECAYLPNVVPLPDTDILCLYRIGSAFYSADGTLAMLRSSDGGGTWVPEGLVWDPRKDQTPHSYTAPHATLLSDGTLLLVARRWNHSDPNRPIFNPRTGGIRAGEHVLFRSTDVGRTWSDPETLDLPGAGLADTPSQIIELNDGRWFLACELWKGWNDTRPLHIKGFAVFSRDQGKTWTDSVDLPGAADRMYSHSRYTRMLDGRIAALQWTQEVGTANDLELHLTVSDSTGTKWSDPQPTGIMGQTSWLADLGDGVLAAAYTSRVGMQPGICVVLSEDEGKTWDVEHQVMVWDAVGQEFLGVDHKPSYPASHDNIAFGKPNAARLPNGDIVCSWWCTQACVTHARWARVRAE
jgi:hypothetical protein